MSSGPSQTPKMRLNTWKEVSAFFGKSERTVKRWEQARGLPIRRMPGAARSTIYAEVAELEGWLKSTPDIAVEAGSASAEPRPDIRPAGGGRRFILPRWTAFATAAVAVIAIAAVATAVTQNPAHGAEATVQAR